MLSKKGHSVNNGIYDDICHIIRVEEISYLPDYVMQFFLETTLLRALQIGAGTTYDTRIHWASRRK
jgi:hypothetical protein